MPPRSKPHYSPSSNSWTFRYQGKNNYLCYGKHRQAEAYALAAKIIGAPIGVDGPITTIGKASAEWLSNNYSKWNSEILDPFATWGFGKELANLKPDVLDIYLKHLKGLKYKQHDKNHPYAPSTVRRQMRYARKVLNWAFVHGHTTQPTPPMPKLPKVPLVAKDISSDDLCRIFAKLPHGAKQVLAFMASTGARPGEACGLKHGEVKGDRCELRRGKTWARTGQARVIHLNAEAQAIIEAQPAKRGVVFRNRDNRPYKPTGLRSIFTRAAAKAGISVTGSYQLRHSWAQFVYDAAAMSLDGLAGALGHEPGSDSTKVYARISQQRISHEVAGVCSPIAPHLRGEAPPASSSAQDSSPTASAQVQDGTDSATRQASG